MHLTKLSLPTEFVLLYLATIIITVVLVVGILFDSVRTENIIIIFFNAQVFIIVIIIITNELKMHASVALNYIFINLCVRSIRFARHVCVCVMLRDGRAEHSEIKIAMLLLLFSGCG